MKKMELKGRPRAVFMAFGTKGDVFPIAAIAASLASDQKHYHVIFISHADHQADSKSIPFEMYKKKLQREHKQKCLYAITAVFGEGPSIKGDFIVINFFALEGWSFAELYKIQCVVAAPYVVPYSAPSSYENVFQKKFPMLYKYLHEASGNEVCWNDVIHWMWPLFTEEWGTWRNESLLLSPLPFTDPVTNLPMWHIQEKSPLLLYGFSKEIVECPGYWPSNAHVCGFWFLPLEWQFSCSGCREILSSTSVYSIKKVVLCANHTDLESFLVEKSSSCLPIFIGLSSIGRQALKHFDMGLIKNPEAFLLVLKAVIEITSYRFILFTAGYGPLDAAIQSISGSSSTSNTTSQSTLNCEKDCTLLFGDKLLCFSGSIPYAWLFVRCAAVVHHGGSGSTAAALHAGIPQILCPFILDQFYWAERLFWLGVAPRPLERHILVPDSNYTEVIKKSAETFAKTINLALLPSAKERALKVAEKLSSEVYIQLPHYLYRPRLSAS
ncbi:Sterol 3-beta-glucosyltransferase UGT80A2 [Apostasia shenzhenica]|uniref:Sterol 3-beta-glucosyltransferase UGT80A2 n=1 Tax=Apostasia shenzhenica TaxID=1088818 RepID=A0A2I0AE33_9ASPA|nr:Sterol 3-beta-glucosyltransferase UGT80A2 [Apostasia shenzhenica]